jgi:hypothetical protein
MSGFWVELEQQGAEWMVKHGVLGFKTSSYAGSELSKAT